MNDNILRGYNSIEKAYEVKNYPYGRLRTSMFYWIETKEGKGDRLGQYTINPKTGRKNAPKYSTYDVFQYLYLDECGHVKNGRIQAYHPDEFEARFEFILNRIGEQFLNDIQKQNIRVNHYLHVKGSAPYEIRNFNTEEKQEAYKKWVSETLKHIKTCEFKDLLAYPPHEPFDDPRGYLNS